MVAGVNPAPAKCGNRYLRDLPTSSEARVSVLVVKKSLPAPSAPEVLKEVREIAARLTGVWQKLAR
jgi:hypothetical protein